jgi:hypothetical protein
LTTSQMVVTVNIASLSEASHSVSVTCGAVPPPGASRSGEAPIAPRPPQAAALGDGGKDTAHTLDTPKTASKARNPTSVEIREHLAARSPLTRREIIAELGGGSKGIDEKLKRLVTNGEIRVEGPPRQRVYSALPDLTQPARPATVTRGGAPRTIPERGVYPLHDAVADLGGATTAQLAQHMELPTKLVVEQGQRLLQLGLVGFRGVGRERVWFITLPETERDAA